MFLLLRLLLEYWLRVCKCLLTRRGETKYGTGSKTD